jgi:hypothetical protein
MSWRLLFIPCVFGHKIGHTFSGRRRSLVYGPPVGLTYQVDRVKGAVRPISPNNVF